MGCDAHMYVEMVADGKWQYVNPPFNEKCLGEEHYDEWGSEYYHRNRDGDKSFPSAAMSWNFYQWYRAFALLAGVRNSWKFVPLAANRSVPTDMSSEVSARLEDDDGCHSHTHFTLEEVRTLKGQDGNVDALIDVLDKNKGDRKDSDVRVIVWFDS